jgi:hypothetical protein
MTTACDNGLDTTKNRLTAGGVLIPHFRADKSLAALGSEADSLTFT